jgi:hypothetical protein
MKRFLVLAFVTVFGLSLAACGNKQTEAPAEVVDESDTFSADLDTSADAVSETFEETFLPEEPTEPATDVAE